VHRLVAALPKPPCAAAPRYSGSTTGVVALGSHYHETWQRDN